MQERWAHVNAFVGCEEAQGWEMGVSVLLSFKYNSFDYVVSNYTSVALGSGDLN